MPCTLALLIVAFNLVDYLQCGHSRAHSRSASHLSVEMGLARVSGEVTRGQRGWVNSSLYSNTMCACIRFVYVSGVAGIKPKTPYKTPSSKCLLCEEIKNFSH